MYTSYQAPITAPIPIFSERTSYSLSTSAHILLVEDNFLLQHIHQQFLEES